MFSKNYNLSGLFAEIRHFNNCCTPNSDSINLESIISRIEKHPVADKRVIPPGHFEQPIYIFDQMGCENYYHLYFNINYAEKLIRWQGLKPRVLQIDENLHYDTVRVDLEKIKKLANLPEILDPLIVVDFELISRKIVIDGNHRCNLMVESGKSEIIAFVLPAKLFRLSLLTTNWVCCVMIFINHIFNSVVRLKEQYFD